MELKVLGQGMPAVSAGGTGCAASGRGDRDRLSQLPAELVGWAKPPGTAACPTNHLKINHHPNSIPVTYLGFAPLSMQNLVEATGGKDPLGPLQQGPLAGLFDTSLYLVR